LRRGGAQAYQRKSLSSFSWVIPSRKSTIKPPCDFLKQSTCINNLIYAQARRIDARTCGIFEPVINNNDPVGKIWCTTVIDYFLTAGTDSNQCVHGVVNHLVGLQLSGLQWPPAEAQLMGEDGLHCDMMIGQRARQVGCVGSGSILNDGVGSREAMTPDSSSGRG
jgi:hypothetical protein